MEEIQIKFDDIIKNNKKKKKRAGVKTKSPKRVSVTQEDMDKLCEVYDWYLWVKDMDMFKTPPIVENTDIEIEEDIVKEKKKISATVDKEIWDSFDSLCKNTGYKKGEMISKALEDFLLKHKDLY